MSLKTKNRVSTEWLAGHLGDENLVVLDASWYKPEYVRVGWIDYRQEHIPGAGFYDIDEIVDLDDERPHMLPPEDEFAEAVGELGIGNDTQVILYDTHEEGFYSSARVWWVFRAMGHKDVFVLDGGLPKWKLEKRPLEHELPEAPEERTYIARKNPALVKTLEDVRRASLNGDVQIVDARSPDRFHGRTKEVAPGLRSGHIPGSLNVFYEDLFNADASLKPLEEVRQTFVQAGVVLDKPILTTCGSGITACILALALAELGHEDIPVYDASWAEWGVDSSCEISV